PHLYPLPLHDALPISRRHVNTDTPGIIGTETLADIDMPADLAVHGKAAGDAAQRRIARALRHQIDAATRTRSTRRGPVEEGAGRSEEHTSELQSRENL